MTEPLWTAHSGEDYHVVMHLDETTDTASIRVTGKTHDQAAHLARFVAELLNAPPFPCCGDDAYISERALRLIEANGIHDREALETVQGLVSSAGVQLARAYLKRIENGDEVPF